MPEGADRIRVNDRAVFSVFKACAAFDWIVGQTVTESKMFAERNRYITVVTLVTFFILLVSLGIAQFYWQRVTAAVGVFQDCVTQIGKGVLSARIDVQPPSDELTSLKNGINTMARNLAERNSQLHESEQKLRAVFDHSYQFMGILLPDGTLQAVNRAALDLVADPEEILIGKPFWETPWWSHSAEIREKLKQAVKRAAGGEFVRFETTNQSYDGSLIDLDFSLKPVADEAGRVVLIIPEGRDITDLKQAEALALQQTAFSDTLLQASPAFIVAIDADGKVLMMNRSMLSVLGYTPDEVIGRVYLDLFVPPKEHLQVKKVFRDLSQKLLPTVNENRVLTKSGAEVLVEWHGQVLTRDGDFAFFIGVGIDITDRKRAETALRESEAKYRHFYNNAQVGICLSTMVEGRIVDCNKTLAKMLGFDSPAQCASEFVMEKHYVDPDQRLKLTDKLRRHGEAVNFEVQLTRRDGTPIWTIISSYWYPKKGLIESVIIDITARRQSEEYLRRLSAAVEQADEAIVITDRDGTIEFVNPAFERITGYAAHEAVGDNPRILKGGKQDDLFYRKLWETISRGDVWRGHFVNRKKDGGFYDEDAAITPIKNNDGVITNYVAVKRDVSRELKTEAQLRQSQKMESIGTLAGGIAHDFNNILGAIMGYTELGLDDLKDRPEQCRWLQQVLEASHRAKDLVGQILTFSRSTAVARAPMKTIPIIKEACKFLRSSLPATIEIKQDIRTSRDLIMGDPTQFHQVLMNLCTNAGHAMQETGGELTVVLETVTLDKEDEMTCPDLKPGAYLKLTVRDTGCGIDRENLEHIFDPYFTTKEQGEGTGLGLAVVHGIVKDGGGDIRVYSEPGKGTTFQVLFPQIEKLEMPVQRNKRDVLPTGTETILLVDDEETLVITTAKLLERLGYTVVSEMNPVKALEKFEQSGKAYDLVMTDKTMPGMTGYELAGKIRQIRPDIPILLCTGFEEKDIMEKMQKTGIKGYIMKPVNRRDLAVAVRRLLNSGDA